MTEPVPGIIAAPRPENLRHFDVTLEGPPDSPYEDNWSPALQIRTILLSIQALLGAPNSKDPLAAQVAEEWEKDQTKAIGVAKHRTSINGTKEEAIRLLIEAKAHSFPFDQLK
ncbi:hypothetical protein FQN50_008070 [Emmonsiellopsis sp. PD_5]|nr:hypothetical protein FQN50_008070 [Emmonsiellopsis sp. PD_5]